ncbi:MAG: phosphoenolpyruvate synthase, partial [Cyanobacteria bacterium HKST-UBA02]|nr:phosphoenolpyruvate synthase [Cyanobacteria bacterium HKST-UBA02]
MAKFIKSFDEISLADVPLVGGKNASLGELVKSVAIHGIQVPHGFCVTAPAYRLILEDGKIKDEIEKLLEGVDKSNLDDLSSRARACRVLIKKAGIPDAVAEEIRQAYRKLSAEHGHEVDVAVRSSATAEDLPDASFAGQQETFLNIRGEEALLEACLNCFASLFTDRAVSYRIDKGFDHMVVSLSIGVQKMVRSDLSSSGVIFTLDTESGFRDVVLVTSSYGLGENIVAGRVDPDEFLVFKTTLQKGFDPILRRRVGAKQYRMIYSGHGTRTTRNIEVRPEDRERFSISDAEVLKLAHWACTIEHHYSELYGRPTAMDIEWAKDGNDGHLYIVQARPETIHSPKETTVLEAFRLETRSEVLVTGRSIGERIGSGSVRTIGDASELGLFKDGEVLVADMTDPDWEPV